MSQSTKEEVELFLNDFFAKLSVYDIFFKNREKNFNTLLELEITAFERIEYIKNLSVKNYFSGPKKDAFDPNSPPNWEFGMKIKEKEVYIKINMGKPNKSVMCISFHIAESDITYPY